MSNEIKCRVISKGIEEGKAIVTKDSISFLGGVDPKTGIVSNLRLCTFDIVSDPSSQSAFVEGILESKQWYCNKDNRFEEVYENLENSLAHLPKHDVDKYLFEQIREFMRKLH
jgi:hypothetical protein